MSTAAVQRSSSTFERILVAVPPLLAGLSFLLLSLFALSFTSGGDVTVGEGLVLAEYARRSIAFGAVALLVAAAAKLLPSTPRRSVLVALNVLAGALLLAT